MTNLAKITDHHIIFTNSAQAEEFVAGLVEFAEEGETYEIKADPKGSTRCIVERFYNGVSEGLC
jgi:hypothetical protein